MLCAGVRIAEQLHPRDVGRQTVRARGRRLEVLLNFEKLWALACGLAEETLGLREWSDAHRVLTTRSSAEAGPYRSGRTPYLRAIMDDLSVESPVQRVVMKKCAQIGASELGNCWIGYLIDQAPGPVLLVQPTVELAKRYSKQRIDTLFDESDRLRAMVRPARSRDAATPCCSRSLPAACW
jgi:phage terminase large subunit GpA-like protein